jgi:hypothetical protein
MTTNAVYSYLILGVVCIIFSLYICCFCCDIKNKNESRNNLIYTNQNNRNSDDNNHHDINNHDINNHDSNFLDDS